MSERAMSVSQLRDQLEELRGLQLLRCAQALRVIRDTCPGVAANIARRALEEAQIPDGECGVCGSTDTYGYGGNAGCRKCGAHDADA